MFVFTGCICISGLDDEVNGRYTKVDADKWSNADGTSVIARDGEGGWSGCLAINYVANSGCDRYKRWGYLSDLAQPVNENVNIWGKKGSSSGITTGCTGNLL